ncbi:MAG: MFS transporter [Terriglobia bacterium]
MEFPTISLRRRWWIVALLSASIAINLVDRQALSLVAPVLRHQFSLSNTQYAYIIVAFQFGMLLGQVPAGMFLDWAGARLGFILIFLSWSVVNALHGLSRGLASLVGLRFLLGLAECGDYSGGIKVVASLFPAETRGLAGGFFNGGAQLGAILSPPLIVLITLHWGWRAAFLVPSVLGLIWLAPWVALFPREKIRLSRAAPPGSSIPDPNPSRISLKMLLARREVLGIVIFRAATGPLTSFYWYWLPEYLRHGRGLTLVAIGLLAWIPYVGGGIGNVTGGFFSDLLIRRGLTEDGARKTSFVVGGILSSLSLLVPFVGSTAVAIGIIFLVVFGNQCMAATYIGMVGDIFPSRIVATVNGIGGVADSGAGLVTMLLTGIIIDRYSYFPVLIAAGVLPAISLIAVFLVIRRIAAVEFAA